MMKGRVDRRAFQILVTRYKSAALVAGGLVVAWNVTNYVLTSYMPSYLTSTLPRHGEPGAGAGIATGLQVGVMLLVLAAIVPLGRLSDRIGRRPVLLTGSLILVVLGLPSIWLMRHGLLGQAVGLLAMGAPLACFAAVAPSTLPAQFPTLIRYGGLGVTFNVFVSLFAGTAPTVIETAVTTTGNVDWPGYYLVAAGAVGVVSVLLVTESAGRPLAGAAPLTSSADLPPPPLSPSGVPMEQPHGRPRPLG